MTARFEGKSVIVTGAASGIGLAAVRLFAAEGARVLMADINGAELDAQAERLREKVADVISLVVDVADFESCAAMVARAVASFGRLDIAFNNAGMPTGLHPNFEDFSIADWRRVIDVNLGGAFNCMKAETPALKAAGGGIIINTASVASLVAAPGMAAYVASKHGVAGLTKAAALDLIRHNIRVNAICPGMVRTGMLAPLLEDPALLASVGVQIPIGRIAEPDEIARAVLFLASPESSYMVGALMSLDGGVTLQ